MPLDTLEELEDDQFYYHEIQGFEVLDENLGLLGTVREVYSVATQNLIALDYQGSEVLIPIVEGIVLKADRQKKQVLVNLPEGLLEVYTGGADGETEKDGENEN